VSLNLPGDIAEWLPESREIESTISRALCAGMGRTGFGLPRSDGRFIADDVGLEGMSWR